MVYDMIVIGGGPGGYTAALYAARAGIKTLVMEKLYAGGQMAQTHQIDNYPGFPDGVDGFTLGQNMKQQAERFGVESRTAEVLSVDLKAQPKAVVTAGETIYGKTVVIATGAAPKKLGLKEEEKLIGKGVAYCAACDGMFYRGKTVVVVGGGNSAVADALLLSRLAKTVHLVHRRDSLRATRVYHDSLKIAENIKIHWNSRVVEVLYEEKVTGVKLENVQTGEQSVLDTDGVFISIGRQPVTDLVEGQLELQNGYIVAQENTCTEIPGVYAVGDVRQKALRQVVTAVADGAVAVHMAEEYLAISEDLR